MWDVMWDVGGSRGWFIGKIDRGIGNISVSEFVQVL